MHDIEGLITRADRLIERLEHLVPEAPAPVDWGAKAFRWRTRGGRGWLHAVPNPHSIDPGDLLCLERQKAEVERNTHQFLNGRGANNVLLWGSRGTGKSSLVKAVFTALSGSLAGPSTDRGLRLIEVDKADMGDLPDILELVRPRPERFILFCDDLSFEAGEAGYTALKAALEGSIGAAPDNLLIYATSNRRHLLPEFQSENREARFVEGELHQGESVEEKISLSDRFGLWVAFHPFTQAQYLMVVRHWVGRLGTPPEDWSELEAAALRWALRRGARSGRTGWQFARDWVGRTQGTG
ncbi:MAG: ATP-binding protein [Chromatiaceae bacterium]